MVTFYLKSSKYTVGKRTGKLIQMGFLGRPIQAHWQPNHQLALCVQSAILHEYYFFLLDELKLCLNVHSGLVSGIWWTQTCVVQNAHNHKLCEWASLHSPHRVYTTHLLVGGFLLWAIMTDCLRRNANPERNLAILPTVGLVCLIIE
jgi:hypothetical protein